MKGFASNEPRFIPAHAGNSFCTTSSKLVSRVHPRACGELPPSSLTSPRLIGSSPRMRGTRQSALRQGIESAVHPRACGELQNGISSSSMIFGSSPRMRGTPSSATIRTNLGRFIPAHAGNSLITLCAQYKPTVHPRACGELQYEGEAKKSLNGSSPRMRGTPHRQAGQPTSIRFIPAHAGNSSTHFANRSNLTVHPRACGELCRCKASHRNRHGSSPRMRGTRLIQSVQGFHARFIPAHAGNSSTHFANRSNSTVHPRACGELFASRPILSPTYGSSPRMRGTREQALDNLNRRRFIPAHAGNSPAATINYLTKYGSSPRMRGTLLHLDVQDVRGRFIPAHAGNSNPFPSTPYRYPVHPRACGELVCRRSNWRPFLGSSPRMRGTLLL